MGGWNIRSLAGFYPLIRLQGLFVTYGHVAYLRLSYQFIFKDVDKRVSKGKRVQREDFSEKQEEEEVNVDTYFCCTTNNRVFWERFECLGSGNISCK